MSLRDFGTQGQEVKPKFMSRAKQWTEEIENLYRFQQAGYRDEIEYKQVKQVDGFAMCRMCEIIKEMDDKTETAMFCSMQVDRWPDTGYVKKLQRRDNTFYYYSRKRECEDKEVQKVKVYAY